MRVRAGWPWSIAAGTIGLALVVPGTAFGGTVLVTGDGDDGQVVAVATAADGAPIASLTPPTARFRRGATQEVWAAPDGGSAWVSGGPNYSMRRLQLGPRSQISTVGDGSAVPPGSALDAAQAYSPDGRFAFTSNVDAATITSVRLGDDGVATPINAVNRAYVSAMVVSPDGRFLFASQSRGPDDQRLTTFGIGQDGRLFDTGHELRGRSAERLVISPDGRRIYGVGGYQDLNAYAVGTDGAVSDLATVSAGTHGLADDLALSPDGRFVYTASSSGVFTFRLGADGVPVYVARADELTGNADNSMAISPDGRSLYFTDWSSGRLFSYAVGDDGLPAARRPSVETRIHVTASRGAIAVVPDQAPVAAFRATPAPAGSPTAFDATASSDPDGRVVRYDWDFGDGTRADDAGPTPQHVFRTPGTHSVWLGVTDAAGTSRSVVYTGRVLRNGGPSASARQDVVVPPAEPLTAVGPPLIGLPNPPAPAPPRRSTLSDVRLTPRYLRLTVDGATKVRVELARRVGPARPRRGAAPRFRKLLVLRAAPTAAGRVSVRLPRTIPRGAYRVRVTVSDAGHAPRRLTMLRRAA